MRRRRPEFLERFVSPKRRSRPLERFFGTRAATQRYRRTATTARFWTPSSPRPYPHDHTLTSHRRFANTRPRRGRAAPHSTVLTRVDPPVLTHRGYLVAADRRHDHVTDRELVGRADARVVDRAARRDGEHARDVGVVERNRVDLAAHAWDDVVRLAQLHALVAADEVHHLTSSAGRDGITAVHWLPGCRGGQSVTSACRGARRDMR